jgi:hypothetical protein
VIHSRGEQHEGGLATVREPAGAPGSPA